MMVAGGLEGGTKGLKFNPRYSAEELQEDSTVGREDSEERAKHDAKKRETQDKRAKQLQGLQHMKIKISQDKHEEDEEDSDMKRQAEAGQMSGQVGQNEANAGANPKGGGMNILLSTAPFIDDAFDMIRKKKGEIKYDDEKPKKTTTIDTSLQRRRAKKGKRSRRQGKKTTETSKGRKGNKKQLKGGNVRQPGIASTMSAARAPYTSFGMMGTRRPTPTGPRFLSYSSGKSKARASTSPREKLAQDVRQELRQDTPTQDITPPMPTITTQSRKPRAVRGSRDSKPHSKATRQPRTTKTPGGAEASKDIALGGGASALAAGGLGSSDAILASEEFLKAQKLKLGISPRDRIEYRQLIDQLNHALRRLMRKADASADDAPSGATPNQGTKRMTSAPTGATETDPHDDPTMWGTHPYDLYTRRGGMG
tara:strand:+ start:4412 stop:5683 length:1272 start_codon:yes stop_codon:yes gene_type:complete